MLLLFKVFLVRHTDRASASCASLPIFQFVVRRSDHRRFQLLLTPLAATFNLISINAAFTFAFVRLIIAEATDFNIYQFLEAAFFFLSNARNVAH